MNSSYVIVLAAKDPPLAVAVLALLHLQSMQDTHDRVSRQATLPQLATPPYVPSVRLQSWAFYMSVELHCRSRYDDACGSSMSQGGSTADHSMQASRALRETTNVAPVAKRGSSRVTVKASAPATDVAKPKTKGKTVTRALQTTGKQASRPSRYALSAAVLTHQQRAPHLTGQQSHLYRCAASLSHVIFTAAAKHDQNVQHLLSTWKSCIASSAGDFDP